MLGYNSEADDQGFFISPDGKHNPKAELAAFQEALKEDDPDEKKNAHCRFPARLRWLKSVSQVPESRVECKNLNAFRKRISGKSISVVFSSYYLNSPGSSFGHTLLRIGKDTFEERQINSTTTELLDTGINYGALTEGANAVWYAIGGLAGFFNGNYNAVPYYYKVREYNDFETRDLWSYQLDLTQAEIDFIVDHIWELGHTRFDYFFLTENCSFHVLTILEAARLSIDLHRHLPRLYTIPSETLKALDKEKLILNVTFRPAPSTLFYHGLKDLKSSEQDEVYNMVFKGEKPKAHEPERAAKIYDTAISLVDFKFAEGVLKGDEKVQNLKRPLLIERSRIPVRSPTPDFTQTLKDAPHLGHGQKRLGITFKEFDKKNFTDLEWRFAFHDFLDRDTGYPPRKRIDVMKFNLRTDGKEYHLRELSVVDVFSLGKWDRFNQSPAWQMRLGQWQSRRDKRDLTTQGFSGGFGYSHQVGMWSPYALAHGETSYVQEHYHSMKLGAGADIGMLFDFTEKLKFQSSFEWRVYPWNDSRFMNEIRYSSGDYGAGAYFHDYVLDGTKDFGVRTFFYF